MVCKKTVEGLEAMTKASQLLLVTVLAMAVVIGGCTATQTNSNTTTNSNTANSNLAATAGASKAKPNDLTMTLPLLDAMFVQEGFDAELKSKLQLTDEQVERLRSISRDATSRLREDGQGERQGTTAAARKQAEEQIKAAIGDAKAGQLNSFVAERYNAAGAGAQPQPTPIGAVPTDTRILVNAPAFRMDVFENGQLVKSYKVSIGYPEFPLPRGMRKADTIIFNPSWTPPDEPWVEASHKIKPGETVKPGDKLNPLGPLKIPIGLPSLIHGGKVPARINNFGSHGCVGLTNDQAKEFAMLLARVGGANVTEAQVVEYGKNKTETKNVKLSNAVPVELRYDTITVEDGKLHIYRDVYDQDTNTEENLRAVLQAYGVTLEQLSEAERAQIMEALREMSRDPSGRLDDNPAGNSNSARSNANAKDARGRVKETKTIKGQKEVVIEIAALQGKGYPAPVALNTGGAQQQTQPKAPRGRKRS
jgi:lipoprotein-anchoring transpeptidase ErfK/SrfK